MSKRQSKRQMRKKAQGSHKNDYLEFSKADQPFKLPDFEKQDGQYNYFEANLNSRKDTIYVDSKTRESSIIKAWYFNNDKSYNIMLRDYDRKTFKSNIEDFFDVAYIGFKEKSELIAIKKLIEPLLREIEKKETSNKI